jgi:glycosyltransferase involved in cell wall biosynthesis
MNRLHHLKETLLRNITDNLGYDNVEFVLLDYNSTDGLEDWVKQNFKEYINSGKLKFYRTDEPAKFHRSHSRNMCFRLSNGDVLCNLDADNFTGEGFAAYINEQFKTVDDVFLSPIDFPRTNKTKGTASDTLGRVCCTRTAFYNIRGFAEHMSTHGFQDYDFANRLELSGYRRVIISNQSFLQAIKHDDTERYVNESTFINLNAIYYKVQNPIALTTSLRF